MPSSARQQQLQPRERLGACARDWRVAAAPIASSRISRSRPYMSERMLHASLRLLVKHLLGLRRIGTRSFTPPISDAPSAAPGSGARARRRRRRAAPARRARGRATICRPIGRPSRSRPQGMVAAGWRVRLKVSVKGVQPMSTPSPPHARVLVHREGGHRHGRRQQQVVLGHELVHDHAELLALVDRRHHRLLAEIGADLGRLQQAGIHQRLLLRAEALDQHGDVRLPVRVQDARADRGPAGRASPRPPWRPAS